MPYNRANPRSIVKDRRRKFELLIAGFVRELPHAVVLRIRGGEYEIDKRYLHQTRFFACTAFHGKCGERWVLKIQRWLVLKLRVPRGVLVREVVDPAA